MTESIQVLKWVRHTPEESAILQERAARGARIDKLDVDRSHLIGAPLQHWSPEAESREPKFEEIRSTTSLAEKMEVWTTWLPSLSKKVDD